MPTDSMSSSRYNIMSAAVTSVAAGVGNDERQRQLQQSVAGPSDRHSEKKLAGMLEERGGNAHGIVRPFADYPVAQQVLVSWCRSKPCPTQSDERRSKVHMGHSRYV